MEDVTAANLDFSSTVRVCTHHSSLVVSCQQHPPQTLQTKGEGHTQQCTATTHTHAHMRTHTHTQTHTHTHTHRPFPLPPSLVLFVDVPGRAGNSSLSIWNSEAVPSGCFSAWPAEGNVSYSVINGIRYAGVVSTMIHFGRSSIQILTCHFNALFRPSQASSDKKLD